VGPLGTVRLTFSGLRASDLLILQTLSLTFIIPMPSTIVVPPALIQVIVGREVYPVFRANGGGQDSGGG
jgi:hypothetical protein